MRLVVGVNKWSPILTFPYKFKFYFYACNLIKFECKWCMNYIKQDVDLESWFKSPFCCLRLRLEQLCICIFCIFMVYYYVCTWPRSLRRRCEWIYMIGSFGRILYTQSQFKNITYFLAIIYTKKSGWLLYNNAKVS